MTLAAFRNRYPEYSWLPDERAELIASALPKNFPDCEQLTADGVRKKIMKLAKERGLERCLPKYWSV